MTPADVLLALVSAGVVLWVDGDRLRYRAPVGAMDEALKARATRSRGALIALIRSGGVLPATRDRWNADVVCEFEERTGMLIHDAGMAPSDAEREAKRLVRLGHTRAFIGRAALILHDEPEIVDHPVGAAVAPCPGRRAARTG